MDKKSFHKVCSAPLVARFGVKPAIKTKIDPQPLAARVADNPYTLLDRRQVEQVFGLGKRWLELAAHRGVGPSMIRISRRMVRYRACDVDAWLASRRFDPPRGG
jgi:predicted DNA-binding transcriptional regulator AlpA